MALATRGGLGRGLDALLGGSDPKRQGSDVRMLAIAEIAPNPNQPRRVFDKKALEELAGSIKSQGVLQPILVRPLAQGYELVAGERRWRASQLAGLAAIPAQIRPMSDEESLAVALIENLQRQDLNPMEEARGLKELQERFGSSQEEVARRVGKSRSAVANGLRLLALPDSIQADLLENRITAGHARALLMIDDPDLQLALRDRIIAAGYSVRESEREAAYVKETGAFPDVQEPACETPATPRPRPSRPRKPAATVIVALESNLSRAAGLKVRMSGSPERGRISFRYDSPEELAALVGRFGVDLVQEAQAADEAGGGQGA